MKKGINAISKNKEDNPNSPSKQTKLSNSKNKKIAKRPKLMGPGKNFKGLANVINQPKTPGESVIDALKRDKNENNK